MMNDKNNSENQDEEQNEEITARGSSPSSEGTHSTGRPTDTDDPLLNAARELGADIQTRYLRLGGVLLNIKREKRHKKLGYQSWESYLATDLHIGKYQERDLRRTYDRMVYQLDLTEDDLKGVKLTSANMLRLARVASTEGRGELLVDGSNVHYWLGRARNLSTRALQAELAQITGGAMPDLRRRIVVTPYPNQWEVINKAFETVEFEGSAAGMESNEILAHICMGFLANRISRTAGPDANAKFFLSNFERIFGGRVLWVCSEEAAETLAGACTTRPELFTHIPRVNEPWVQPLHSDERTGRQDLYHVVDGERQRIIEGPWVERSAPTTPGHDQVEHGEEDGPPVSS